MRALFFLLPLIGCTTDEPAEIHDEADFFNAFANASCDQLMACEPESWLGIEGHAACVLRQKEMVRNMMGGACTGECSTDLDLARQCVDDIALLTCRDQVVDGFIPDACWNVRIWDFENWDGGELPPG